METRARTAKKVRFLEAENPPEQAGPSNAAQLAGPSEAVPKRTPGRLTREMLKLNPWRINDLQKLLTLRKEKNVPWADLTKRYFIEVWGFPRSQFVFDREYWASQSKELLRDDEWYDVVCEYENSPHRLELERVKWTMTEGFGLMWPDVRVIQHRTTGKLVSSYTRRKELTKDFNLMLAIPIDVFKLRDDAFDVMDAYKNRGKNKPHRSSANKLLVGACAAASPWKYIKWLIRDCGAKSCWDAVAAAAGHGHNDVIDLVVKEFRTVYADFEQSELEFQRDYQNSPFLKNWDPLVAAAVGGHNDTIDFLAERYGLSPNGRVDSCADYASMMDVRRDDITVIIHKAASRDHVHTVKHLIDKYDYHPTTYTYWDETVLDVAIECKAERTISFLRERGAQADWESWSTDSEYEYDVQWENDSDGDCVPEDVMEQLHPRARSAIESVINMPTDNHPPLVFSEAKVLFQRFRPFESLGLRSLSGPEGDEGDCFGQNELAYVFPSGDRFRRVWRKLGGSFKKKPEHSGASALEAAIEQLTKFREENPDMPALCSVM